MSRTALLIVSLLCGAAARTPRNEWSAGGATLQAAEEVKEPRFAAVDADAGAAVDAGAHARLEPITIGVVLVLKLVAAVAGGVTEMHKQRQVFIEDEAAEDMAEIKTEAAEEAQQLIALYDAALGDLDTRYRDTIADLGVDMLSDADFSAESLEKLCTEIENARVELAAAAHGGGHGGHDGHHGGGGGAVHNAEELGLITAACGLATRKGDKADAQTQALVALLTAALRREYDAVFGWTATKTDAVILKGLAPGFGAIAGTLPATDTATAEMRALAHARLGVPAAEAAGLLSKTKLSKTADELMHVNEAFSAALDEVKRLVEVRADERSEEAADEQKAEMLRTAVETTVQLFESIGGGQLLPKLIDEGAREIAGKVAENLAVFVGVVELLHGIAEARTAASATEIAKFATSRNVAVLREHVAAERQLAVIALCDMMHALQLVLSTFLESSAAVAAAFGADKDLAALTPDNRRLLEQTSALILGTQPAGTLPTSDAFKAKLVRTLFARLCALLGPTLNRMAALYRGGGLCVVELVPLQTAVPQAQLAQLGAPPRTAWADAAALAARGPDGARDIYDLQLATAETAALLTQLGWEAQGEVDRAAAALNLPAPALAGELNGPLCDPELTATTKCKLGAASSAEHSRRLLMLRRDAAATRPLLVAALAQAGARFTEPISDLTIISLPRTPGGGVDREPYNKALRAGWRLLRLFKPAAPGAVAANEPFAKKGGAPSDADILAANLNAGASAATPVVVALTRRGGRTPLEDVASLPFHALQGRDLRGAAALQIDVKSNDLALAEIDALAHACANILSPADCVVTDFAEAKNTLPGLQGFMTRFAASLSSAKSAIGRFFSEGRQTAPVTYYAHTVKTMCKLPPPAGGLPWVRDWERLAVSPKDGAPLYGSLETTSRGHWRAELIRPYIWVLRRFVIPTPARDGLIRGGDGAVKRPVPCAKLCGGDLIASARDASADIAVAYRAVEAAYAAQQAHGGQGGGHGGGHGGGQGGAGHAPPAATPYVSTLARALSGRWQKSSGGTKNFHEHPILLHCDAAYPAHAGEGGGAHGGAHGAAPPPVMLSYASDDKLGTVFFQFLAPPKACPTEVKCPQGVCACVRVRNINGARNGVESTLALYQSSAAVAPAPNAVTALAAELAAFLAAAQDCKPAVAPARTVGAREVLSQTSFTRFRRGDNPFGAGGTLRSWSKSTVDFAFTCRDPDAGTVDLGWAEGDKAYDGTIVAAPAVCPPAVACSRISISLKAPNCLCIQVQPIGTEAPLAVDYVRVVNEKCEEGACATPAALLGDLTAALDGFKARLCSPAIAALPAARPLPLQLAGAWKKWPLTAGTLDKWQARKFALSCAAGARGAVALSWASSNGADNTATIMTTRADFAALRNAMEAQLLQQARGGRGAGIAGSAFTLSGAPGQPQRLDIRLAPCAALGIACPKAMPACVCVPLIDVVQPGRAQAPSSYLKLVDAADGANSAAALAAAVQRFAGLCA